MRSAAFTCAAADQAAGAQVQTALRSKSKSRDDITVIVVDVMQSPEERMPVRMQKDGGGHSLAEHDHAPPVVVHRLLEGPQGAAALQEAVW